MVGGFVTGFYHAGVTVQSMEKSLDFYCGLLGLELHSLRDATEEYILKIVNVPAEKIRVAFLKVPGSYSMVELLEYVGVERHPSSVRPCDYGSGHFCLYVNDLDQVYSDLASKGVQFRSTSPIISTAGLNKGSKIVYCIDPDGYLIELIEPVKK